MPAPLQPQSNSSQSNIVNPEAIPEYLRDFAKIDNAFDESLYNYLQTALVGAIKKTPECFETLEELPDNPPGWLAERWGETAFHVFKPTPELKEKIYLVRAWIEEAMVHNEDWLKNTDEQGRPLKLLKIGSLDVALKEAQKSTAYRAQKCLPQDIESVYFNAEILGGDIETIMTFNNGYRFVRMLSVKALDKESEALGHCIGNGSYDNDLPERNLDTNYSYISLRNHKNESVMSAQVWVATSFKEINQCCAKGNSILSKKHLKYLLALEKKTGIKLCGREIRKMGLIRINGKIFDFAGLPEGYIYIGDLDLDMYLNYLKFPKNLTITGNLTISSANEMLLPDDLKLEGKLAVVSTIYSEGGETYKSIKCYDKYGGPLCHKKWMCKPKYSEPWNLHRRNGPAHIMYNPDTGEKISEEYYIHGALAYRRDDGLVVKVDAPKEEIIRAPVTRQYANGHNPMALFATGEANGEVALGGED